MNKMKILLALLLALTMLLCACGQKKDTPATTKAPEQPGTTAATEQTTEPEQTQGATQDTAATTQAATETEAAGTVYTVKVVDENGNPIAGVMVQLCDEACWPAQTNAEGIATWSLEEANYKASFMKVPDGYALMDETNEFYYDEGNFEMTLTLKVAG